MGGRQPEHSTAWWTTEHGAANTVEHIPMVHYLWYITGALAAAMFFSGGYCLATFQCRCRERLAREDSEALAQQRTQHLEQLVGEYEAMYQGIAMWIRQHEGRL